ncbi:uncharacterized protein METZ01_LOCUS282809, partial [marine metagenome]
FGPHVAHECGGRIAWPIALDLRSSP